MLPLLVMPEPELITHLLVRIRRDKASPSANFRRERRDHTL
jgi:hypothetical protein